MAGRLIGVVGPSGVGKDSVMEGLCAMRPDLHRVRRCITRAADAGGEDFQAVTPEQFARMQARGEFTLWWGAHDLRYGIPAGVHDVLTRGQDAIVNLSRGVLREAEARFAHFHVISLTAAPEVLAERLARRGRETPGDIANRLAREAQVLPKTLEIVEIRNDRPLEATLAEIAALYFPANV
ncbi:phosphonate metabolism protein/1,5-bisphosphokinase (PRPP-forming) PhnN [uncultured Roseobacter sp.]|uniref:phosphonate metabolism protein/1,5-bisphosphokinase (PRPP-forming) PhnN n=1 Tax=uncultured Roseobacter sp. TaxID=114847 RepID=UPI0026382F9E|nr:phosphonate metabolism protein/1,5-bisphosphokinase (PRPP-forming) PhnN [uncultured Roseobacter sp.]